MYGPLALLVVATALFAAGVVWWRVRRRPRDQPEPDAVDLEQVQGFVYVGSGGLVVLGAAVLVLGALDRAGPAEAAGVLGLLTYLVYLSTAVLLIRRTARRTARRATAWPPFPNGGRSGAAPREGGGPE